MGNAADLTVLGGARQARNARKEDKKARQIQQRMERIKAGKQVLSQIRNAQIARAEVVQQSESAGVGGSSAVAGALGSIQSQAGGNMNFAQTLFGLSQQANRRLEAAHKARGKAADSKAITDLGMQFAGGA